MQINNAGESKCSVGQNILLPCMRNDVRQVWSLSHWFLKGCYRKLVVLIISIVVTLQRTLTDKPLL